MPAPFAHFALFEKAKEKFCESDNLIRIQTSISDYSEFGLLGANSPDFPIVCFDKVWEGNLHGSTASNYVKAAIEIIPTYPEEAQKKFISWFCGYISHMVGDAVIHPIVNERVGRYLGHESEHQRCEIHQDAFIFKRLGLDSVGKCEFVKNIIRNCCEENDRTKLDSELVAFWRKLTETAFPKEAVPNFNLWFATYTGIVDLISEESEWFSLRYAAGKIHKEQLIQMTPEEIEETYIFSLPTLEGKTINYEALFNKAVNYTVKMWKIFGQSLDKNKALKSPLSLKWDLNTGEIVKPEYLFWEGC